MTIKYLVKKSRWGKSLPVRREEEHPFFPLQRRMNELFDSFFRGFELEPFGAMGEWYGEFSPQVDVKETEKEISVTAELPGLDEKDIDVSLTSDTLTLKGEKKEEKGEKGESGWRMERRYGSFYREIPLPEEIEAEKVDATFKKGVLRIAIPKTAKAEAAGKKIPIKVE